MPPEVRKQILIGHFGISLPVLPIMLGPPTLFCIALWQIHGGLAFVGIAVGVYLGYRLAWAYWARAIVAWRLKAFSVIDENDWLALSRAAVKTQLIWPEGHAYEKTEKRSPAEAAEISLIGKRLKELEQVELVNDDFTTPACLKLAWNRNSVIVQVLAFAFPFILGTASLISSRWQDLFGWLVLLVGVAGLLSIRQLLPHLFYRGVAFSIDHNRIESLAPTRLIIQWASIESLYIDDEKNGLIVNHLNPAGIVICSEMNLGLYKISNKALFKRQVKVFADRYRFGLMD